MNNNLELLTYQVTPHARGRWLERVKENDPDPVTNLLWTLSESRLLNKKREESRAFYQHTDGIVFVVNFQTKAVITVLVGMAADVASYWSFVHLKGKKKAKNIFGNWGRNPKRRNGRAKNEVKELGNYEGFEE